MKIYIIKKSRSPIDAFISSTLLLFDPEKRIFFKINKSDIMIHFLPDKM